MAKISQGKKLLDFLKSAEKTGVTSLDIIKRCKIVNTTGRISDLRKDGHIIECRRENNRYNQKHLFRFFYVGQRMSKHA